MLRPLVLSALIACAATDAAQADMLSSTQVLYGDLNITNPADAKILAGRLHAAATEVCLQANGGEPTSHVAEIAVQQCVARAIGGAIATIQRNMEDTVRLNLASYTQ